MDFFKTVEKRTSIRSFKKKPVSALKLKKILNAVYLSPSAGNLQARKILIVKDQKVREKLNAVAGGQKALSEAPLVLAFFCIPKESSSRYGERGARLYAWQDAAIAAAYAQLAASALGFASVWVGAFDDAKVKEILKAPQDYEPVALLPIGYANEKGRARCRKKWDELFSEKF